MNEANERAREYKEYIISQRANAGYKNSEFKFDETEFQTLIEKDDSLKRTFYNKQIRIHLHTDGIVGHLSADLPMKTDKGIEVFKNIGLDPKDQSLFGLIKSFGVTKGSIFTQEARGKSIKTVQTVTLNITEELYNKIALKLPYYIKNPPDYNVGGFLGATNCFYFLDDFFKECGILDGLSNKFDSDEFSKRNFRAINIIAGKRCNNYEVEKAKVMLFDSEMDSRIADLALAKIIEAENKKQAAVEQLQIKSDISTFLKAHSKKENLHKLDLSATPKIGSIKQSTCGPVNSNQIKKVFDFVDPNPGEKPPAPEQFAIANFHSSVAQYNPQPQYYKSLQNVGGAIMLKSNDFLHQNMTYNNNFAQDTIRRDHSPDVSSSPSEKPEPKYPMLSDFRIGAGMGGIGIYATVYSSGQVSLTALENGVLFLNTVSFGPGFWSAMFTGIGIGLAIAAPVITAQLVYQRKLKIEMKKTKNEIKNSIKNSAHLETTYQETLNKIEKDVELQNIDQGVDDASDLIDLLNENIQKEKKLTNKSANRGHKKASRGHKHIINENYDIMLRNLLKIRAELQLKILHNEIYSKYKNSSVDDLLSQLTMFSNKQCLSNAEVSTLNVVSTLFIEKASDLFLKDPKAAASIVDAANNMYLNNKIVVEIQLFNFSVDTDNHKGTNHYRGQMKSEINNCVNNINAAVARGENPSKSIEGLLAHVEDKIKHYQRNHNKSIEKDLIAFKNILISAKDNYSNNNVANSLNLNEISQLFQQFYDNKDKSANFWQQQHEELKNCGTLSFININTEIAKKIALHFIDGNLIRTSFSESINQAANKDYTNAKNVLDKLVELVPDTKSLVIDLCQEIEYCKANDHKSYDFFLKRLQSYKEESNDTSYVKEFLIRKICVTGIDEAKNKDINEFYFHASKILKKLRELTGDSSLDPVILIEDLKNRTQVNAAFLQPSREIIERVIQGCRPSKFKTFTLFLNSFYQTVQAIMPNTGALSVLVGQSIYEGTFEVNKEYFWSTLQETAEDISTHKELFGWRMVNHLSQYPVERLFPQKWSGIIQAMRSNWLISASQYVYKGYSLYQGFKAIQANTSANVPLFIGSIANSLIGGIVTLHDGYNTRRGNADEMATLYPYDIVTYTAIDGICAVRQMSLLHSSTSWSTRGILGLSIINVLHTWYARNTKQQMCIKKLGACWSNLQHYEMLRKGKESRFFKSIIDSYLDSVTYLNISVPSDDDLKKVDSGKCIILSEVISDDNKEQIVYVKQRSGKRKSIILTEHYLNQYSFNFRQKIKELVIDMYERESLDHIEQALEKEFGFAYDERDEELINHCRIINFDDKVNLALTNRLFDKVLSLSKLEKVGGKDFINRNYKIPPYLCVNVILKRLATIASRASTVFDFYNEYVLYTQLVEDSSKNETKWRSENWNTVCEGFTSVVKSSLRYIINLARNELDLQKKQAYLDIAMQNYYGCGEWHNLLDDEYKFLFAYCFFQLNNYDRSGDILKNIDILFLLKLKHKESLTKIAIEMFSEIDRSTYFKVLKADRDQFELTDNILEVESKRMLKAARFDEMIVWLQECQNFNKRDYYLARAYYESNERYFFQACIVLFKEPNQDFDYWSLAFQLLSGILNKVKFPTIETFEVWKQLLAMTKVCCEQISIFQHDDSFLKQIRDQDIMLKEQLLDLTSSARKHSGTFFKNNCVEEVDEFLLEVRQWMLSNSRSELRANISLLLDKLNLIPEEYCAVELRN